MSRGQTIWQTVVTWLWRVSRWGRGRPTPAAPPAAPSEPVADLIRAARRERDATMRAKERVEAKRRQLEAAGQTGPGGRTGHFVYDAMAGHGIRPAPPPRSPEGAPAVPPATTEGAP